MRTYRYLLLAAFALSLNSCEKDDVIINDNEEIITPEKEEEVKGEKKFLSFETLLTGLYESRAGAVKVFEKGHNLSIINQSSNYKYVFNGETWESENPFEIKGTTKLTALFPYMDNTNGKSVILDIQKQEDVMWASSEVSEESPSTVFDMQHKLALLQFKLVKDEYLGNGLVSNIQLHDTYLNPRMEIATGKLSKGTTTGSICLTDKYIIENGIDHVTEFIVSPKNWGDKAYLTFNLDGKEIRYDFAETDTWESGLKYTYTIKLRGKEDCEVYKEDVPVNVEFWSQYGKTDDIILKEPAFDDNENFFTISVRHKTAGYCAYQNEGAILHFNYMHYGENPFNGKVRAVLTKNGEIVEKFQPIAFDKNNINKVFECQAFITSNPGIYKIDLLFQREGNNTWFHGMEDGLPDEYTIKVLPQPADNVPALRELYLEKEEGNSFALLYRIPHNDSFNITSIISNKNRTRIKGTVRAVWERQFNLEGNSYFPSEKRENSTDDIEWFDIIGEKEIDIPSNVRFWKSNITCKIPVAYAQPKFWVTGWIHLYWKGENDKDWSLVRLDTDNLFNNKYDGYVCNSVTNTIGVWLDSWK